MHQFQCDYIAGCHPAVLKALCETNLEEVPGYGEDVFCKEASDMIRAACGGIDADVHFLSGGTQTNLTLIAAALRPTREWYLLQAATSKRTKLAPSNRPATR